ncbi:MAG: Asp23/Gls24 family envelope stress response protein [Actinomycetota bacterium]|nr:Asp23/Gls24 family envelope stress response protein [Actinomycetota bacterium]
MGESPEGRPDVQRLLDAAAVPCGTPVDALLEQVAAGRAADLDAHQRDCVHCRAALTELAALWAPVIQEAAAPVPVPPDLAAAVMSQIRVLVRDVWYTLQTTGLGGIRIAARTVAALARDAARTVPGVRVALGRSTQGKLAALAERATFAHRHPHAAVGVLGRTAVVDLAVAVSYGDPVHDVARGIQQRVIATLRDSIGLQRVIVNITVDDVLTGDDK